MNTIAVLVGMTIVAVLPWVLAIVSAVLTVLGSQAEGSVSHEPVAASYQPMQMLIARGIQG